MAAPVAADPPSWAPAHGWRAKQHNKHKQKYKRRYDDDYYVQSTVPYGLDLGRCNRDVLGAVLGGAAGAAVGSTVDKHDGRSAAIVGGAIIGVLVGGAIGRYMERHGPGLHHLALKTADIDATLSAFSYQGLSMIDIRGRPGSRRARIGFIHPRSLSGVLVHLVERDDI